LLEIKKEFEGGNEELVKVMELRRIEQEKKIMEEFVQKFQRVAKESRYKERVLVEEFKREMNRTVREKTERPPTSIEQWYKHATNLDRY